MNKGHMGATLLDEGATLFDEGATLFDEGATRGQPLFQRGLHSS